MGAGVGDLDIRGLKPVQSGLPARMVNVQCQREHLSGNGIGLFIHLVAIPFGINPQSLVKRRALLVADRHGGINGGQEKLDPQLVDAAGQFGVGFHQQGKGLAMAEFIVAPFLEPLENRVKPHLRVFFQMAVDGDVAGIANLFRQIGGVKDEFGLEIGVFLGLGQKAQIDSNPGLAQGVIDETGMAGLVAGHQLEQTGDILVLATALHFLVQHTARKFGGATGYQKIGEFGAQFGFHPGPIHLVPIGVLLEMALVRVGPHPRHQSVPFGPDRADVNRVHLVKVGGIEPGRQQGVLHRHGGGLFTGHRILQGNRLVCGGRIGGMQGGYGVHGITSSLKENSHSSMNSKSPVRRVHRRSTPLARTMVAIRCSSTNSP